MESSGNIPKVTVSNTQNETNDAEISATEEPATEVRKRIKVALAPGHSQMDWIRLTNSGKDLSGTDGQLKRVTMSEVRQHKTEDDAWMVYRGKVYNITPYIEFHPGGKKELMRGAGKDATKLFDFKHKWVNADALLGKCLVGYLVPE